MTSRDSRKLLWDAARRAGLASLLVRLLLVGLVGAAHAAQPEDLLDPRQAFRLSAAPLDDHSVAVTFRIADGYYMYRDRFRFASAEGRVLADVDLPSGERKNDPFFGETEIYRRQVTVRVPLSAEEAARGRVKLRITSQGCADIGVCYAPLEQMVEVPLPAARGKP
ncbi:MAG TPA: protein-disulfide reductase DsbD N-terminal domain-containing protein [Burkholderiaceae bacterium]|nr:protein-disulfide reductase DsbD N-terminal domain-containing protein [Burkholderiaceae bacterium]